MDPASSYIETKVLEGHPAAPFIDTIATGEDTVAPFIETDALDRPSVAPYKDTEAMLALILPVHLCTSGPSKDPAKMLAPLFVCQVRPQPAFAEGTTNPNKLRPRRAVIYPIRWRVLVKPV